MTATGYLRGLSGPELTAKRGAYAAAARAEERAGHRMSAIHMWILYDEAVGEERRRCDTAGS